MKGEWEHMLTIFSNTIKLSDVKVVNMHKCLADKEQYSRYSLDIVLGLFQAIFNSYSMVVFSFEVVRSFLLDIKKSNYALQKKFHVLRVSDIHWILAKR